MKVILIGTDGAYYEVGKFLDVDKGTGLHLITGSNPYVTGDVWAVAKFETAERALEVRNKVIDAIKNKLTITEAKYVLIDLRDM